MVHNGNSTDTGQSYTFATYFTPDASPVTHASTESLDWFRNVNVVLNAVYSQLEAADTATGVRIAELEWATQRIRELLALYLREEEDRERLALVLLNPALSDAWRKDLSKWL